ncbi:tetratricopeptide repeat protein [Vibrio nitrifigilis]|uniref:Tetratricopeptide repeat protein n=1 Tax=Vibrio nitrifigilis TaxID=2789781 RepID=A0ABS0GDG1_9VIBR|nr:tetratricopeptide repeat protein [Vibrio nitrifigilis]MBF9000442.1 tetratricopeptide repeat protein [Vibrio nitrifigilis]
MRKIIIFLFLYIINFVTYSSILSDNELALSLTNTENVPLNTKEFKTINGDIDIKINKSPKNNSYEDRSGFTMPSTQDITININDGLFVKKFYDIPSYGQFIKFNYCLDSNNVIILSIILKNGDFSKTFGAYLDHKPLLLKIKKDKLENLTEKHPNLFKDDDGRTYTSTSGVVYPYISSKSILNRLVSKEICVSNLPIDEKIISSDQTISPPMASKLAEEGKNLPLNNLLEIIDEYPVSIKNVVDYNNIGYFLYKNKNYKSSKFILEYILQIFPKRTVAYINLGDTYWKLGEINEAKHMYKYYIYFMKKEGKESKIPTYVLERKTTEVK